MNTPNKYWQALSCTVLIHLKPECPQIGAWLIVNDRVNHCLVLFLEIVKLRST